jgi:hypothetical protein
VVLEPQMLDLQEATYNHWTEVQGVTQEEEKFGRELK